MSRSNIGMRGFEWTSSDPIKPLFKFEFNSTLEAMLNLGIQVYFMDEPTFARFYRANDYREQINILKRIRSENMRRGINILNIFPDKS